MSLDITWDGTNAIDYFSSYNFLNWIWHLQQKSGATWTEVKPTSMSVTASQDANGCYVTRQGTLSDGSTFLIKYSLPNDGALKFTISYTPTKTANYRLWFELSGLEDGNTNTYVNYTKPNGKRVHFVLPFYVGLTLDFDYNEVSASLTQSEQFDTSGYKYNYYVEVGSLKAGTTYTVDPTTVSTNAGQYATALGNSRKLFRDAYGKYIALYKSANVRLGYCNNDPPTSGWVDNDLGSTFAVDAGEAFGVAGAYDSTNDRLMVAWFSGGTSGVIKAAQITFTRSSGNITGYSASSVLSITPAYAPAHNPSLWMLHNGEVAAVWGADKTSGAKHSVVEFCRLVFGNPPTYKNAAGTAGSKNTISSDYTTSFIIRYPTIVQRTNSGTGQYDMFAFWTTNPTVNYYKNKATWSSPNWSWGTEGITTIDFEVNNIACAYDSYNGLIIYGSAGQNIGMPNTKVSLAKISSSDTDTDISKTGLPAASRYCIAIAVNQNTGDYYVFYQKSSDIYYMKYSGGSWGSETQFTTSANENYPSCKVDQVGNRIELIWTHYTGSAYNVYYDSLTVGVTYVNVSDSNTSTVETITMQASMTIAEAGSGLDAPSLQAQLSLADSGIGNDVLQSIGIPITDSGAGSDALSLQAQLSLFESGIGIDSPSLQAQLSLSDSGVGSDYAVAGFFVEISDSGVGSDMISQLQASVPIGDIGQGLDTPQLQGQVSASDAGSGTDILSTLQAQLSILDSGVGLDVLSELQAQLSVLESGRGIEAVTVTIGAPPFSGIIKSALSMLERDMTFELRQVSMTFSSLERKMEMEQKEIGMMFEQLERKMKMELIE